MNLCGACADEVGPVFSYGPCDRCSTVTNLTGPAPTPDPITVAVNCMPRLATEPPRWSRLWPIRSKR